MAKARDGSKWSVTIAGQPPRGHGSLVEPLADGRLLAAIGYATQSGFEFDYELGDVLLQILVAAARSAPERGYTEVAAALRELVEREALNTPFDDGLPAMTALAAVCSSGGVELSWVGNHKAYVVRGREVVAETLEHSIWRTLTQIEIAQAVRIWPSMLGAPSRTIKPHESAPEFLQLPALEPDDALVLVSGALHSRVDWRAGVERALRTAEVLDAVGLHRELWSIAAQLDPEGRHAWTGPLVVIQPSQG